MGEVPMPQYGSCNLGSINISHNYFYGKVDGNDKEYFNINRFQTVVEDCIQFLDNVGSYNKFPNQKFENWYNENRPVGLGIMGFADALLKLNLKYGTSQTLDFIGYLMQNMYDFAAQKSISLGLERGIPKNCQVLPVPMRNITLLSIAPTGSISFIADCSFGIEPFFSKSYTRIDERGESYVIEHPLANSSNFVIANDINWKQHIDIQAKFQEYVDSSISKTINMHNSAKVSDVLKAFYYAWKKKCKGITVYRDNSRQTQVLNHNELMEIVDDTSIPQHNEDVCNNCQNDTIIFIEGCSICTNCGYSECSIK